MTLDIPENEGPGAPGVSWPARLPWQQEALLEVIGQRSAMPHALLIHGQAGIGKHALALHLAQALLCEAPRASGAACDACAGCRYAMAGQHPDLMRLERSTLDEESGEQVVTETIAIDRVRALIDFVQLTSHRQGAKVAVIAPAERMNANAANALLKTLEEPPAHTYILLVTDHPGRLPPTIVSRCRPMAAPFPPAAAARDWLLAQGVKAPETVLAQAGGAPLAALRLADQAVQTERQVWLAALAAPFTLPVLAVASRILAGGREDRRARLAQAIDWLLYWTGDLARVIAGASPQRNPDFDASLRTLAPQVAPLSLFRYHRMLLLQRGQVAHPLVPHLVAEALLIGYRTLFNLPSSR
ncbi:MAG: DNA polymerase III subunit delta' [Betaproteobacteria bacterium]